MMMLKESIPISVFGKGDSTVWIGNPNGEYTLYAGYKTMWKKKQKQEQDDETFAGSCSSTVNRKTWKTPWKILVKQKIKMFI